MKLLRLKLFLLFLLFQSKNLITKSQTLVCEEADFNLNYTEKYLKLEIECCPNKSIILDDFESRLSTDQMTSETISEVSIIDCHMSGPVIDIIDVVEAEINQTISKIYLKNVRDLEARHMTGVDDKNINVKLIVSGHHRVPFQVDLFSTVPLLQKLYITVELAEHLPDLSKLNMLESLNVTIGLNGNGNQLGI